MANNILYSIGGSSGSTSIIDKYPPNPVTNLAANQKSTSVELTWTDPEDLELVDGTIVKWAYTGIVRKAGSVPANINDGTLVINSAIKNQYQAEPYIDTDLDYNITYYYVAFSVSETSGVNTEGPSVSVTISPYKVMTVVINEADSNPATCCSYADDAIGMESGKNATEWAKFFGYRPCLFKDGQVVGYLNPNDFTRFDYGDPADITSGDAGDVMIEFPRHGIRISKTEDIITVSMTDDPDNPEFTYYAHTRGTARKDYFYLGAYLGTMSNGYLRSLSDKLAHVAISLSNFRNYAHRSGTGYEVFTFYQWIYIQIMYVLQFKNLDSQTSVGMGYVNASTPVNSGSTNANGMIYGSASQTSHVKLFGIEDIWGNVYQWIDGFYTLDDYRIVATTDNFNDNGAGYTDVGTRDAQYMGYMDKAEGTSELGLVTSTRKGSRSTYYCDYCTMSAYCSSRVGGNYDAKYDAGMFAFGNFASPTESNSTTGSRLSYY